MRRLLAIAVLLLGSACQHSMTCCRIGTGTCPESVCSDNVARTHPAPAPSPPPCEVQTPHAPSAQVCPSPPKVEIAGLEEVRVKAPPQKIVVESPAPAAASVAPQMAVMQAPVAQAVPQSAQLVPVVAQAAVPQANMVATTTQTTSAPRARVALGLDWIRIPFPLPRLFAVPGPQEVTTQTQYFAAAPQPVAMQAAVAAPMAQGVMSVAAPLNVAVQPTAVAVGAAAPTAVAVPGAITQYQAAAMPAQAQVAMPVAVAAPPAQAQVAVPVVTAVPPAQVMSVPVQSCDQAASHARVTRDQLIELTKQIQALEQQMTSAQTTPPGDKKDPSK
jgi:hypothetical protein